LFPRRKKKKEKLEKLIKNFSPPNQDGKLLDTDSYWSD
jgi:hypothetical protein